MADAMGATYVDGLRDRFGSVSLAGVNRDVDVVVSYELERCLVMLGRVVVLRAGEIEPHDPAALVRHGELRHFERALGRHVPNAADDDVRLDPMLLASLPQAGEHTLDDGRELEATPRMQHRRVAHFHVSNVLARSVLRELVGDSP